MCRLAIVWKLSTCKPNLPQIVNKRGTEALSKVDIDLAPHRKVPFAGVSMQVRF